MNPTQAASMPSGPARSSPIAMPVCEDAGPGMNWHSATRSANVASVSHCRLADQIRPEIAEMRHRAAEAGAAQPQEHQEDFEDALHRCPGGSFPGRLKTAA